MTLKRHNAQLCTGNGKLGISRKRCSKD